MPKKSTISPDSDVMPGQHGDRNIEIAADQRAEQQQQRHARADPEPHIGIAQDAKLDQDDQPDKHKDQDRETIPASAADSASGNSWSRRVSVTSHSRHTGRQISHVARTDDKWHGAGSFRDKRWAQAKIRRKIRRFQGLPAQPGPCPPHGIRAIAQEPARSWWHAGRSVPVPMSAHRTASRSTAPIHIRWPRGSMPEASKRTTEARSAR